MKSPYVEQNCTFEHEGRKFSAGGAVIVPGYVIGYPGKDGVLHTWHGEPMGTYRITSTWKTPRSCFSSTMSQIEAVVDGKRYTGRGAGLGCIYRGKEVAK